jgi:hypothetical protein
VSFFLFDEETELASNWGLEFLEEALEGGHWLEGESGYDKDEIDSRDF